MKGKSKAAPKNCNIIFLDVQETVLGIVLFPLVTVRVHAPWMSQDLPDTTPNTLLVSSSTWPRENMKMLKEPNSLVGFQLARLGLSKSIRQAFSLYYMPCIY
jgi:hypothetical protein